ncbi:LysR family transcriptional regulator [Mesosutterella sp. OilRF-GAM-744-9]|uniref:LysR family transcriptional regulator n=1 Tax=Mesosutterella porci TaxID=2915351 RepID=A0ABS9MRZ7_9BURK|nr:LysR family transcriptional regulator [Mesosutterella sp. oilRF-744-WT-GAM-9]MCG5031379.1 LysR family transcriptional regulator [Mesosutterella sp. oilRF-744-WT-GAM-9]
MPKSDDLYAWKLFASLMQSRSFSVTAQAFGVEPSTVSRAISALENSIGQKLVNRSARPLTFTSKGEWAARKIEPILAAHRKFIESFTHDTATLEGQIRLSVPPSFATRNLMPILEEFYKLYPRISFDILVGMQASDVKSQKCDMAALTGKIPDSSLIQIPRGRCVYLPVASPEYVKAHGMPLNPQDLSHHTVFLYTGPMRSTTRVLWKGHENEVIPYGRTIASTDMLSIREGVLKGYGVALDMPVVQCWEDLKEGRMVPVLPGWKRPPAQCYMVLSKSSWHIRRCRVFAEWYAKKLTGLFRQYEREIAGIVPLEPDAGFYSEKPSL